MIESVYRQHYGEVKRRLWGKPSKSKLIDKAETEEMKIGSSEWWHMEYARRDRKCKTLEERRNEIIAKALNKYGRTPRAGNVQIIHDVARKHGVTYADIIGPSRFRRDVKARTEAIQRVKLNDPKKSLPELGRMFGGRDHTTILHALRKPHEFTVVQEPDWDRLAAGNEPSQPHSQDGPAGSKA